ncbi:MAG: zinc ribbon domain-containing protein [Acidobacteriia bacterium]|nr:zinc ribbon domain-containing protein [Terriglobia bacterium]
MAQFCTKCGAPMGEGMSFCTSCGASVAGPPAPAARPPAAPPPSAAPAGAAPVTAAPASKSGSPIFKIILAVVAVLIFFSLLGVGACVYVYYRARQKVNQLRNEARITFPTSVGTQEVRSEPEGQKLDRETTPAVDLEVPIYPGATHAEGGGAMSFGAGAFKVQQYTTDDSVDKVVSFYRDKMGSKAVVQQSEGKAVVQVAGSNGLISVTVVPDDASGKTKFTITRIGK